MVLPRHQTAARRLLRLINSCNIRLNKFPSTVCPTAMVAGTFNIPVDNVMVLSEAWRGSKRSGSSSSSQPSSRPHALLLVSYSY